MHHNLKPENILISLDEKKNKIYKISDYGFPKEKENNNLTS